MLYQLHGYCKIAMSFKWVLILKSQTVTQYFEHGRGQIVLQYFRTATGCVPQQLPAQGASSASTTEPFLYVSFPLTSSSFCPPLLLNVVKRPLGATELRGGDPHCVQPPAAGFAAVAILLDQGRRRPALLFREEAVNREQPRASAIIYPTSHALKSLKDAWPVATTRANSAAAGSSISHPLVLLVGRVERTPPPYDIYLVHDCGQRPAQCHGCVCCEGRVEHDRLCQEVSPAAPPLGGGSLASS